MYPTSPATEMFRDRAPGESAGWTGTSSSPCDRRLRSGSAALAFTEGCEFVNGYNPLDVRAYREFVWIMMDGDTAHIPLSVVTQQTMPNIESSNAKC